MPIVLASLHRWLARSGPDADLLARFVADRDADAFAGLVDRHGPLVLGAARRSAGDPDADDVFQATFLALARHADRVRDPAALPAWLHRTAHRLGQKAARSRRRRWRAETANPVPSAVADPDQLTARELMAALDEELVRLPESHRLPLILCCLEGLTVDETAGRLGLTPGAVKGRLERGRRQLRDRLAGRGLGFPAVGLPLLLAPRLSVAAPLRAAAVRAALSAGKAGVGVAAVGWVAAAVGAGVVGLGALRLAVDEPRPSGSVPAPVAVVPADAFGDPLPAGAVARFGTVRQRAPGADLAVSPDGKEIVTVDPNLTVRRFDAATGALRSLKVLDAPGHTRKRLSPSGRYLLTHGLPGPPDDRYEVAVWDLATGKRSHDHTVTDSMLLECAEFSPDETRVCLPLVSGWWSDHSVRVWDLRDDKVRSVFEFKEQIKSRYADSRGVFSPDGTRLVFRTQDNRLRCRDLPGERLLWDGPKCTSNVFFFTPDGSAVVTLRSERLDAATGQPTRWPHKPPNDKGWDSAIGYSPDGRLLAFHTMQLGVRLWEPATGKASVRLERPGADPDPAVLYTMDEPTYDRAFTPDGTGFVWRAGAVQRWDLRTGRPVYPDTTAAGHTEAVSRVEFSPDGRRLASLGGEGRTRVWDLATGRTTAEIPVGGQVLAFTGDGRRLLGRPSLGRNPVLVAWDAATCEKVAAFGVADPKGVWLTGGDRNAVVTPDGKTVAVMTMKNGRTNDECILAAWDAATGKELRHGRVPWGEESAFTPDATAVLAFDWQTWTYRLIDIATEKVRLTFAFDAPTPDPARPNRRLVYGKQLAVSPDGRFAAGTTRFYDRDAARYEPGDVYLGDTATGEQLAQFPRAGEAALAFSPDSRLFAAVDGNELRLWETAAWKLVGTIRRPDGPADPDRPWAGCVAISPDNRRMATGHPDGTVTVWAVPR